MYLPSASPSRRSTHLRLSSQAFYNFYASHNSLSMVDGGAGQGVDAINERAVFQTITKHLKGLRTPSEAQVRGGSCTSATPRSTGYAVLPTTSGVSDRTDM